MTAPLIRDDAYLRTVVDALPSAVFVVDGQFRIFDMNAAARTLFGIESGVTLRRLCGDIMHCLHAIEKEGCGATAHCPDCAIRNSVAAAGEGGSVHRRKYRMKLREGDADRDLHMLVTASPFLYKDDGFVLLVLEDITEIVALKRLLPICSHCHKIRNDQNYWEAVHEYLAKHADIGFTHGICPHCAQTHYPELKIYE